MLVLTVLTISCILVYMPGILVHSMPGILVAVFVRNVLIYCCTYVNICTQVQVHYNETEDGWLLCSCALTSVLLFRLQILLPIKQFLAIVH